MLILVAKKKLQKYAYTSAHQPSEAAGGTYKIMPGCKGDGGSNSDLCWCHIRRQLRQRRRLLGPGISQNIRCDDDVRCKCGSSAEEQSDVAASGEVRWCRKCSMQTLRPGVHPRSGLSSIECGFGPVIVAGRRRLP